MKSRFWVLLGAGLIAVIVGGSIFGYDQWSKSDFSGSFVSTDDAQVVADLVQVGSLNAPPADDPESRLLLGVQGLLDHYPEWK